MSDGCSGCGCGGCEEAEALCAEAQALTIDRDRWISRHNDAAVRAVAAEAREKALREAMAEGLRLAEWLIEDERDQRCRVSTASKARQFAAASRAALASTGDAP